VANIYVPHWDGDSEDWRRALLGAQAGCEQIGISLYELAPGERMVFHYHLQNEEALIVIAGRPTLRTSEGEQELDEGSIVGFPRGERGAHGFSNQTDQPVRVLVVSELNAPNVSVYPDTNEVGIFDTWRRSERRFGALFNLDTAVSGYAGGQPTIGASPPSDTD